MMSDHSRRRGFTLIELLVVIAVISILAALLLPALQKAVATSRSITCVNQQKQHYLAIQLYLEDWSVYPPAWQWPNGLVPNDFNSRYQFWYGSLVESGILEKAEIGAGKLFWCPEKVNLISLYDRGNSPFTDYGLSYHYMNQNGSFRKPSEVKNHLAVIMEGDKILNSSASVPQPYRQEYIYTGLLDREVHVGGANTVFFDGHAKWFSWSASSEFQWQKMPFKE